MAPYLNYQYIISYVWVLTPFFSEHVNYGTDYPSSLKIAIYQCSYKKLTLKQQGGQFKPPSPPLWFFENVYSKERVKPCLFATFNIIISHIFPENFTEIPQVVQKI